MYKMEFYYSLDDLKELSPLSTDTQENIIMKCKALQQEVDDLKADLSSQREYSHLLQEGIKELQQELQQTENCRRNNTLNGKTSPGQKK